jgi:hypothetical protein
MYLSQFHKYSFMTDIKNVRKSLRAAILFAVGGALAFLLSNFIHPMLPRWARLQGITDLTVIPIPFAVLSAVLFLRTWKALAAVPLNVMVWFVAYAISRQGSDRAQDNFWILVAGVVGGVGVALSDSVCCPHLLSPKRLSLVAFIGFVAAVPFAALKANALIIGSPAIGVLILCAFALWQASVGTYLYIVCTQRERMDETSDMAKG